MTTPQDSRVTVEAAYGPGYDEFRNKWIGDHEGMCADLVRLFVPRASRPSAAASGDDELVARALRYRTANFPEKGIGFGLIGELCNRIEALTRAQPLGGDER